MRLQCQSCGGVYNDELPDGMLYFHRCPPLSASELADAVQAGHVKLPPGETADDAVQRRTYERVNARDENRPSTKAADAGKLRAPGADVVELEDPAPAATVVVDVPPAIVVVPPPDQA